MLTHKNPFPEITMGGKKEKGKKRWSFDTSFFLNRRMFQWQSLLLLCVFVEFVTKQCLIPGCPWW
jgi:hypothetical protein